MLSKIRGSKS